MFYFFRFHGHGGWVVGLRSKTSHRFIGLSRTNHFLCGALQNATVSLSFCRSSMECFHRPSMDDPRWNASIHLHERPSMECFRRSSMNDPRWNELFPSNLRERPSMECFHRISMDDPRWNVSSTLHERPTTLDGKIPSTLHERPTTPDGKNASTLHKRHTTLDGKIP